MTRPFFACVQALALALVCGSSARAAPVYPPQERAASRSLNGDWSFKYVAGASAGADEGFTAPQFSVASWPSIAVPANWELKGFAEPSYADELKQGIGLYRRAFRVPAEWRGRRIYLRFEGVAFGYGLWVNGNRIGESSASAFNPHTFDVTDAVSRDADNVVAVRVSTRPHAVEFDLNDDWSLSGIYRDVTLFTAPQLHLRDLSTSTRLGADGAAELAVAADLSAAGGEVRAELLAPGGRVAGRAVLRATTAERHAAVIRVAKPALWTAETPWLYRLRVAVYKNGKQVQSFEQRIGLREVSIAGGMLLLNGRPFKLRGVNHHDLDPRDGRAISEARLRADLLLMKRGNVNFVRTSHYPPDRRLLALCDELGLYVMDEVAIGHGEANLEKPEYRDAIMARVRATIARDKNHASVLVWSIGNENPITEAELDAGRLAKSLDPSRPITIPKVGSYFNANQRRIPAFVDLHAPHYPVNKTLAGYAQTLERPAILTEYAHALGLATDRIQDQWEIIQASPVLAGGSIWHFMDQAILRTSAQAADTGKPTQLVWLDPHRYLDTHGLDGADGLTYGDRTPQVDFWQMRKVYAPVQIGVRTVRGARGGHGVMLDIENRHDFRSLAGMTLHWEVQRNGKAVQHGTQPLRAAARARESMAIPLALPDGAPGEVFAFAAYSTDERGLRINERTVRLPGTNTALKGAGAAPDYSDSARQVRVSASGWVLTVERSSGQLQIADSAGRLLVAGIHPHIGRAQTMAEALAAPKRNLWNGSVMTALEAPAVAVERSGDGVHIAVSGRYRHVGQTLTGGYRLEIRNDGAIAVSYAFAAPGGGVLSEAGLSLELPSAMTEFRWVGQGPYAGYPGKDRLNEFGIFHLNRRDLHFQGNRRGTELALVTAPGGEGVALSLRPGDVAVERRGEQVLLSHNVLMGGLGNKGTVPETTVVLQPNAQFAGSFTLLPLSRTWPDALVRWFGAPAPARQVYAPFHHSYDQ